LQPQAWDRQLLRDSRSRHNTREDSTWWSGGASNILGIKALCRSRIFRPMPTDFHDILFTFEFVSGDGSNKALLC
jgi:hypothetical protein